MVVLSGLIMNCLCIHSKSLTSVHWMSFFPPLSFLQLTLQTLPSTRSVSWSRSSTVPNQSKTSKKWWTCLSRSWGQLISTMVNRRIFWRALPLSLPKRFICFTFSPPNLVSYFNLYWGVFLLQCFFFSMYADADLQFLCILYWGRKGGYLGGVRFGLIISQYY